MANLFLFFFSRLIVDVVCDPPILQVITKESLLAAQVEYLLVN